MKSTPSPGADSRRARGAAAEEAVARALIAEGREVLDRNFRTRGGELDLVYRDGATFVFVEIRSKTDLRHGGPAQSITPAKRRRWRRMAEWYLAYRRIEDVPVRFELAAVRTSRGGEPIDIEIVEDPLW